MNKSVKEIKDFSVTFSIWHDGNKVKISERMKKKMLEVISKNLKPGYEVRSNSLLNNTVIFQRGTKKKKFTAEQVKTIKEDNSSIRIKAAKYKASTSTIMKIMHDKYL